MEAMKRLLNTPGGLIAQDEFETVSATLLNNALPLTMSRKVRRQMRRRAMKECRQDAIEYLDTIEGAINQDQGSKRRAICFQPRGFEEIEKKAPAFAHTLCERMRNEAIRLNKEVAETENIAAELLTQADESLKNAKEENRRVLEDNAQLAADKALLTQQLAWDRQHRQKQRLCPGNGTDAASAEGDLEKAAKEKVLTILSGEKVIPPLTVTECLQLVEFLSEGELTVLPSAWESASEVDKHFRATERLLMLLSILATSYRRNYLEGGDTTARQVFSVGEFSAKDSDATSSGRLGEMRTFVFEGREVRMERHLRIGVANNKATTLRVYFDIVGDDKRIVIGWCGKHLPTIKVQH